MLWFLGWEIRKLKKAEGIKGKENVSLQKKIVLVLMMIKNKLQSISEIIF